LNLSYVTSAQPVPGDDGSYAGKFQTIFFFGASERRYKQLINNLKYMM
jgi:hypothetical protein